MSLRNFQKYKSLRKIAKRMKKQESLSSQGVPSAVKISRIRPLPYLVDICLTRSALAIG
jgi:hypothetical protein